MNFSAFPARAVCFFMKLAHLTAMDEKNQNQNRGQRDSADMDPTAMIRMHQRLVNQAMMMKHMAPALSEESLKASYILAKEYEMIASGCDRYCSICRSGMGDSVPCKRDGKCNMEILKCFYQLAAALERECYGKNTRFVDRPEMADDDDDKEDESDEK